MNIDEFEILMEKCRISLDDREDCTNVIFEPFSAQDAQLVGKVIKNNHLENCPLADFQAIVQQYKPAYQARRKLKQQKAEDFSRMTTGQVEALSVEQKLEYLEILFPAGQTKSQLMEVCRKNEANIKACLLNMPFPESFWNNEKKSADRFVSLIAGRSEITDKIKHWQNTTLEDKKQVIKQAGQIFNYVYGIAPHISFFTPEEEKAKRKAQGLNENAHINAAYFVNGRIYFNEERLQNSDNFFAISVLFHEGTHMRQHCTEFEDKSVDRILKCDVTNANVYEDEINNKNSAEYKDIYTMQPSEVHAHGLQKYVEDRLTEKTGIEKTHFNEINTETKQVHNKAFSMAAVSQYLSSQHEK